MLILLVIAAVVLVVADRVAASVVQQRIATTLEKNLQASDVEVSVAGFPFLTQLAGGSLADVTGHAATMIVGGVMVEDVDLTAAGVPVSGGATSSVAITGLVPTASLQVLLDQHTADLDWLGNLTVTPERERLQVALNLAGVIDVGVDVEPVAAGRSVGLRLTSVVAGGVTVDPLSLPFGLGEQLVDLLGTFTVSLEELPAGLEITAAQVTPEGLWVTAAGQDVVLTGS